MKRILILASLFAAGFSSVACEPERTPEDDDLPAVATPRVALVATENDCPHTWDPHWTATQLTAVESFTDGRHNVPEYNDCQRFIEGSNSDPTYGSVFAIFISGDWSEDPELAVGDTAPVAMIRALGAYPELGMTAAGFYCLILQRPSRGRWSGGTVNVPDDRPDCSKPDVSKMFPLDVEETGRPGGAVIHADSLPGVVRWAFDTRPSANGWVHYATLPCNGELCNIGPVKFVARPVHAILNSMFPGLPKTGHYREIDMWNDFQLLASPASSSGSPVPGAPPLFAVMSPANGLDTLSRTTFQNGWQRVAEVAISGSDYEAKWNFSATGAAVSNYNLIDACYYEFDSADPSDTGNCTQEDGSPLPDSVTAKCGAYDPTGSGDPGRWRSRHTNAVDGSVTYHCIELKPFDPALAVPGTVRWKWDEEDEKSWFRCPDGCCLEQE